MAQTVDKSRVVFMIDENLYVYLCLTFFIYLNTKIPMKMMTRTTQLLLIMLMIVVVV